MGHRRMARELALQVLYSAEIKGEEPSAVLADAMTWRRHSQEARQYADSLAAMAQTHGEECDRLIQENAEHWEFARIAMVDRIILRLGICELLHGDNIPPRVAIDEAIELAKKYSTEKSSAFINGILDAVLRKSRSDRADNRNGNNDECGMTNDGR